MGVVIPSDRIVPAWLAAVAHLDKNGRRYRNMMIEIEGPDLITPADKRVIQLVDDALRQHRNTSVLTVAGTIFPQALYKRFGAADLAANFLSTMKTAKKPGTWGTYAMRLMARPGKKVGEVINPLELLVAKLKRAAGPGNAFVSNYELGVHEAGDLLDGEALFCDVPLYNPSTDGAMVRNQPCLSHMSFKLVGKAELELTAIYRSHFYAERALGNFIGLRHLMNFVASEAGVRAGRLTCISTDAYMDYESWGGSMSAGQALMLRIRAAAFENGAERTNQISTACEAS